MHCGKSVAFLSVIQLVLIILYIFLTKYDDNAKITFKYAMFQDVHVMIYVGFGFLMVFLRRCSYSAVGFNFLLAAIVVQWALICQGFSRLDENYKINVSINSLADADVLAAAVLISMGAVLGKMSHLQLVAMGILETVFCTVNMFLGQKVFLVTDAGGSIFIHCFGAYFGLSVDFMIGTLSNKKIVLNESSNTSNLFSLIGTLFLWAFWPSFNAIDISGIVQQQRAVVNTYFSLVSCCVTSFIVTILVTPGKKIDIVHIQNSTLAGGVAIGSAANLILQPYGSLLVGCVGGFVSVLGYRFLGPFLAQKWNVSDTCGVHNLHGLHVIFGGLLAAAMTSVATKEEYGEDLFGIFPAMARTNETHAFQNGRSSVEQAGFQLLALLVTLSLAIASGVLTGKLLTWNSDLKMHSDEEFWKTEEASAKSVLSAIVQAPFSLFKPFINPRARISHIGLESKILH